MVATIYRNAVVFTGDATAEPVEAFATSEGKFTAVGSLEAVRAAAPEAVEVDLAGAFVAPGAIETHAHLMMFGESLSKVQLRDCNTVAEMQDRLVAARAAAPDAKRILGVSWRFEPISAAGSDQPTAAMLDAVLPDVPVYLDANDLHSAWVNSAALAEMGITRDTPNPVGGEIVRDENGDATGFLLETAAVQYVWGFLQEAATDADRDHALDLAFDAYLETGVTGAVDMALMEADFDAVMRRLDRDGKLPFPYYAHWMLTATGEETSDVAQIETVVRMRDKVEAAGYSEWFRIIGVKFILDGVIDACTAAMRAPYKNGDEPGPIWTAECARPVAVAADKAGLQIAMHAIGDAASDIALDALALVAEVNGANENRRHRIEHLEYVAEDSIPRLAEIGVIASMQPVHCDPAVLENWKAVLGDERAENGFPWRKLRESGAHMALGTDAPTAPYQMPQNLYIALTGGSAIDPTLAPYHPERAFAPGEAIAAQTSGAAYASRIEHEVGRIAPGLIANAYVLDVNPLSAAPEALLTAKVLRTLVAGETAFAV